MKLGDFIRQNRTAVEQMFRDLPAIIGEEAVHFVQDNFDRQSWNGEDWERTN
ncbi:MAG: hypothetical protein Q4G16_09995 [Cruoricaptor ignavus]|nr:hypothetical protein [Cruoricaptor ignavus]